MTARHVGFAHRRLRSSIWRPASSRCATARGNWITYNGEIYNYIELRRELGEGHVPDHARTPKSCCRPTAAGAPDCVDRLRGMFAFAIWDEASESSSVPATGLASSRSTIPSSMACSTAPARRRRCCPFLPSIETDVEGFKDYLAFQFCLAGKTLFSGIHELLPGHTLTVRNGARP